MPRGENRIDLTGQTFGDWLVIQITDEFDHNDCRKWLCRCQRCDTEQPVSGVHLREGESTKCKSCAGKATAATSESHARAVARLTTKSFARTCPECGVEFLGTARQVYCRVGHRPSTKK